MVLCSAYFQWGSPIYSAISVRFCMGHPKCPLGDPLGEPLDDTAHDKFIWTYSSPEFPMAQVCHYFFLYFCHDEGGVICFLFLTKILPISMLPWNCFTIKYSFFINSISGAYVKDHIEYRLTLAQVWHSMFRHSR